MMFYVIKLILLVSLLSKSWELTENQWKEAIVEVYSNLTEKVNERKSGAELFSDDAEELWPGVHLERKEGLPVAVNGLRKLHPMAHENVILAELLYSSSDVAIVKSVDYIQLPDGNQTQANGLDMFVQERNEVKIKLSFFTFE